MPLLDSINGPDDVRRLSYGELDELAEEIRDFIVQSVARQGGHLGSNLGAVELTLALHRVFDTPRDILLWDTGHQAYVHKLVTGRREGFAHLRQAGGMSGYPSRLESEHDWIENSHASTVLSYAHGMATALALRGDDRRVVAVIGHGSLTGGMAFEGLNNLGVTNSRVVVVLNDNGRSYAPTHSKLGESLARLRLDPRFVRNRARLDRVIASKPNLILWQVGTNAVLAGLDLAEQANLIRTGLARMKATRADVVLIDPRYVPEVINKPNATAMVKLLDSLAPIHDGIVRLFSHGGWCPICPDGVLGPLPPAG